MSGPCVLTAVFPSLHFSRLCYTFLKVLGAPVSSHKGKRPNTGLLDEDRGPSCAGTCAGARLPASDSRNQSTSLLTVGRTLSFPVRPVLGQMQTQTWNIFLLPLPPLSSLPCIGYKVWELEEASRADCSLTEGGGNGIREGEQVLQGHPVSLGPM